MDALKKSVGGGAVETPTTAKKKPEPTTKTPAAKKGISLVKASAKRKSA
jgi:hypothetical protein